MRRAVLFFAAIAPLAAIVLWHWSVVAAIGIIFLSHMLVLYPTLRPTSQWLGPVVTSFETAKNEVWLTIDDGPAADTTAILDLLEKHQAKATFFVKGINVDANDRLTADILRRGHQLGNHSWSHPSGTFWALPPHRLEQEIDRCSAALARFTGTQPPLFRAPVGMKNPFVHPLLARRSMFLIGWNVRAWDAVRQDGGAVVERIVSGTRPGAVILMHQGGDETLGSLTEIVERLSSAGYAFVVPESSRFICGRRKMRM